MKLTDLLRSAPGVPSGRRRRKPRADAPRTIVPVDDDAPITLRLDAARERLRREIPPVDDDE